MDYTFYLLPIKILLEGKKGNEGLIVLNKEINRAHIVAFVDKVSITEDGGYIIADDGTGAMLVLLSRYLANKVKDVKECDVVEAIGDLEADEKGVMLRARNIIKINIARYAYNKIKCIEELKYYWNYGTSKGIPTTA
jgi:hypothetical protein